MKEKKRIQYKITPEIRNQIQTDSDMEDYAREHHMNLRDFDFAIRLYDAVGTPCEGCKNVCYLSMSPCSNCSRGKKDYYESI